METVIRGRAFVFGKNIDTDQIYPGRFVEYTEIEDIKKYAMYGADEQFTEKFKPGDIIVADTNFGCGSSREHAAITLKAVNVGAVIADSFGRIFFRNAINNGLLLIENGDLADAVKEGDKVVVIDDLLATGGTIEACCKLIEALGGEVADILVLMELEGLNGREKLSEYRVDSVLKYEGK